MPEKKIGTLIKAYQSRRRIREGMEYDSLLLVYRDEKGEKKTMFVDRAEVPFYVIKDKSSPEAVSPPMFIEKDKVEKITTFSDLLFREIAVKTDSLYYFDRVITTWGAYSNNMKNLFKHNWLYDSDMDFVDRYMAKFHEEYAPDINYKLHKCYFDIEVDLMPNGWRKDAKGNVGFMGFPDEEIAPCPVNIITLFDEKAMAIHTFVVRNDQNESLKGFESKVDAFKKKIAEKLASEDEVPVVSVSVDFYHTEEGCIEGFFERIHKIDPDFALAWNQSFDVLTLQNRLKKIYSRRIDIKEKGIKGFDQMLTAMSDTKYMLQKDRFGNMAYLSPKAYYVAHKDKPFVDRTDSFDVMDGINWMDQMLYYANIRKSSGQRESYSLDAIANEELGKEKLEFGPGETIKTLAWTNFEKFAEYNIRDVVLLHLLEEKNLDMDLLQRLSEITNTRKEKVFRKTISLKNFVSKFALEQGYVMTNNRNANYGDDSAYFNKNFLETAMATDHDPQYLREFDKRENYGGFVLDPNKNLPDNGIVLNGRPSKYLFRNIFDMDFSSLYPSIIRAYNLDKNTQVGKFFLIDDHIKNKLTTRYGYDGLFALSKNDEAEDESADATSNDIGTTLVDSLVSFDFARVGEKYFDLPSTAELIQKIEEKRGNSK